MQFVSPATQNANHLLWGDWDKGEYGVLVRALDWFDDPKHMAGYFHKKHPNATLYYLPASLLHASLRPSNSMFPFGDRPSCGYVVGTKLKLNWSMKQFQKGANGNDDAFVSTPVVFPTDCGSEVRNSLTIPEGYGCHIRQAYVCINKTSCLTYRNMNCACDYESVPGRLYGEYMVKWCDRANCPSYHRLAGTSASCWYPNSTRGMEEMRAATNSLWLERRRWSSVGQDEFYRGWTELPASSNIRDKTMMDAIIVKIPVTKSSLESLDRRAIRSVQSCLKKMFDLRYDNLPVIIMRETKGLNQTECNRVWEGKYCNDGYRKEIFSQSFNFSDGSCLYKHDECDEVYYYPMDNRTGSCSVFSNGWKTLCASAVKEEKFLSLTIEAATFDVTAPSKQFLLIQFGSFLLLVCFIYGRKPLMKR